MALRNGVRHLRILFVIVACVAFVGVTYLVASADVSASVAVKNSDVVAAARTWTTVDVRLPEPSDVTFQLAGEAGATVFTWTQFVETDYRFEWRGRTTDGDAVADAGYTLNVIGGGLDESIRVKVKNEPRRKDQNGDPDPPNGLTVFANSENHVVWEPSPADDRAFYRVYSGPSSNGPWVAVATRAAEGAVDTPASTAIVWYRVSAVDLYGNEGELSAAVSSDRVSMTQIVGRDGGVLVPTTGTIRLEIPAGVLSEPTPFTIEQVPTPPEPNVNRVMVTRGFEITPHEMTFDPSATLTLRYDIPGEHVLPSGFPEDTTVVQYWDEDQWRTVPDGAIDRAAQTISVPLRHLSLYQGASVTDPHGGYSDGTDLCGQCHTVHDAPGSNYLYARPTQKETCYQCHDGTGASTDVQAAFGETVIGESTKESFHPVPTDSLECGDCHTPHKLRSDFTKLLRLGTAGGWVYSPAGSPIGNNYCYECHGSGSTYPDPLGDKTSFEGGVHEIHGGVPASGSGIQCVVCHDPHGSDHAGLSSQETTCYGCHNATTPNTNPDLPFDKTELEYAFSKPNDYDAGDADGLIRIYHHPIGEDEQDGGNRQVECASCHNSHNVDQDYSGSTSKLSDPGDTRFDWLVTWTTGSSYGQGNISQFCVDCHQTPATIAPINAGTWVPYDVRLTDDSGASNGGGAPHDTFNANYYFNDPRSDHGNAAQLVCTACHDPHGSSNAFMLREYVISPAGADVPAGTESPPVTGFDDTDTAAQRDILTSFCDGCHTDHHGPSQPCTACHYHGSGRF